MIESEGAYGKGKSSPSGLASASGKTSGKGVSSGPESDLPKG